MTIAHPTPTQSARVRPATLAMTAGRQPQQPPPETEHPAKENAAPEVSAVAVLGYN